MGVVSCGTTMLDQGVFQNIGAVTWDTTAKTAGFTAVSGNGYFVNTTSGAITVTLPAGSAGAVVALADYAATWQTNSVTVAPNGSNKIGGTNANATLTTQGQSVTFVYVDSTQGWVNVIDSTSNVRGASFITATGGTITTSGNYKIHKFTGPGTFAVSGIASCSNNNIVSYMVVAGGGGGAASHSGGGGGGAGGFREYKGPADCYSASPLNGNPGGTAITVTATPYPITVGGGGSAGTFGSTSYPGNPFTAAGNGGNSVFSTITSTGGGAGGGLGPGAANGSTGGSGGGGVGTGGPNTGGAGNTPPVSPSQGFAGGNGGPNSGGDGGGGGGGATQAGTTIAGGTPADGGDGATTSITASPTAYGGGGGGGSHTGQEFGSGGTGGGGDAFSGGPFPTSTPSTAGTANTGGGGGAGTAQGSGYMGNGAAGGSGIVVIRYKYQ